ncbi:hypothetical protein KEM54_006696 [Ascosphaera aggregata]|nr:hypothetical protein KEM54_006696 [Ascosphaera aggregata]
MSSFNPQPPPHIIRRIMKELASVREDDDITHLSVVPLAGDEDITQMKASFPGPQGTAYEGGTFWVEIRIPPQYPFKPPLMRFITRIWHPNVSSQTGTICLDTLGKAWSPILTLKSALISLQSLLSTPEPRDPQDAEVAKMLLESPERYERVARSWTAKYAGGPAVDEIEEDTSSPSSSRHAYGERDNGRSDVRRTYQGFDPNLLHQFCSMGFDILQVARAFTDEGIPRDARTLSDVQSNNITARLLGE